MTNDEFKEEVKKLIAKLIESDNDINAFVMIYSEERKFGFKFGYGCEGCAYDHIQELKGRGHFSHNRADGKVH